MFRRSSRKGVAALVLLVALAVAGCDGNSTVPAAPLSDARRITSPSATGPTSPHRSPTNGTESYAISDVRLVTVRDPVVFWQVSFDARWVGDGPPEEARCRWRMLGVDGVAIISGGIELDDEAVDDEIAASVYPDEIPGVPKSAAVDCRTS